MGLTGPLLSVCVFCAAAAAQPDSGPDPFRGNVFVTTGKVMAYGGMGVAVYGYFFAYHPEAALAGLGAFALGPTLIGIGAGEVNRAAQAVDSGYHANPRGWGWNVTGLGLILIGTAGLAQWSGASPGTIYGGALLIEAGLICEMVALGKFSFYARDGRKVLAAHDEVSIVPLWLDPHGRAGPGLLITYRY
jgi:hypothetical protein